MFSEYPFADLLRNAQAVFDILVADGWRVGAEARVALSFKNATPEFGYFYHWAGSCITLAGACFRALAHVVAHAEPDDAIYVPERPIYTAILFYDPPDPRLYMDTVQSKTWMSRSSNLCRSAVRQIQDWHRRRSRRERQRLRRLDGECADVPDVDVRRHAVRFLQRGDSAVTVEGPCWRRCCAVVVAA